MLKTKIIPVKYPSNIVKTIPGLGFSEDQYLNDKRGDFSYEGNSGHSEPTLVISPFYKLTVSGIDVPVYSTVVYIGQDEKCALHSYSIIEVSSGQMAELDVDLISLRNQPKRVTVHSICPRPAMRIFFFILALMIGKREKPPPVLSRASFSV